MIQAFSTSATIATRYEAMIGEAMQSAEREAGHMKMLPANADAHGIARAKVSRRSIVAFISAHPGSTIDGIAAGMNMLRPTVYAHVSALVKQGRVEPINANRKPSDPQMYRVVA